MFRFRPRLSGLYCHDVAFPSFRGRCALDLKPDVGLRCEQQSTFPGSGIITSRFIGPNGTAMAVKPTGGNMPGIQSCCSRLRLTARESPTRVNQLGYDANWWNGNRESLNWLTPVANGNSGDSRRMDLVGFTYHHSLAAVLPKSVFRKKLQIFNQAYWKAWGANSNLIDHSKGFFPTEMAFTEGNSERRQHHRDANLVECSLSTIHH